MKAAIDTDILVYAEGFGDDRRVKAATRLIDRLRKSDTELSVQVCAELLSALVRKFRCPAAEAFSRLEAWRGLFGTHALTTDGFDAALVLVRDHRFQMFDAMILSSAAGSGCKALLSEDMHSGFKWRGVTIVNPFSEVPDPMLEALTRA